MPDALMDLAPKRRQRFVMKTAVSKMIRQTDRINLRLPPETFATIDAARRTRPGNVSRNTWITEAIEEKLERMKREQALKELINDPTTIIAGVTDSVTYVHTLRASDNERDKRLGI